MKNKCFLFVTVLTILSFYFVLLLKNIRNVVFYHGTEPKIIDSLVLSNI